MDDAPSTESAHHEQTVSIGTWNMDHWRRTAQQRVDGWSFLRSDANADVMLLQESVIPSDTSRLHYVHREIAGTRAWGSSVVALNKSIEVREIDAVRTRYGATRFSMLGTLPGAAVVTLAEVPGIGAVTCVSVYGVINVYSQITMFRIVADLIPLFDSRYGENVVLGGDFNVTSATKPEAPEFHRYQAVLNAVESLGLVNLATLEVDRPDTIAGCPCATSTCRHVRTFGNNPGTQLDWLYATRSLAQRCTRLRVNHSVLSNFSDHAPLIADFRLGPSTSPQVVDPESFLVALGSRVSSECALVAENLIDWALRKHQELDHSGTRIASLDRLPTTSGDIPELWVQLDLRRPQGLQYTFSLTCDGQIVIQFQRMTAPFEVFEARENLWSKLTQIDGVTIDKRLNGRPTFPISALAIPERRLAFERIMSELVDATLQFRTGAG
jgi:endonuclease/exonuclease/phosphatase family metal-dependent hydrolase